MESYLNTTTLLKNNIYLLLGIFKQTYINFLASRLYFSFKKTFCSISYSNKTKTRVPDK